MATLHHPPEIAADAHHPEVPMGRAVGVYSFDPCIACAVHVVDAHGREYTLPNVRPNIL